jgi:hypothetical protein
VVLVKATKLSRDGLITVIGVGKTSLHKWIGTELRVSRSCSVVGLEPQAASCAAASIGMIRVHREVEVFM